MKSLHTNQRKKQKKPLVNHLAYVVTVSEDEAAVLLCVPVVAHQPFAGASNRDTFSARHCAKKMKL